MQTHPLAVRQPAEWESHSAVWTAWPSHPGYWEGHIEAARRDVAGMIRAIALPSASRATPERVHVWAHEGEAMDSASAALQGLDVDLECQPLGDIWFRDVAPIFVRSGSGSLEYRTFRYNGWGGKYVMKHDDTVASRIAAKVGLAGRSSGMIFEGGALDVDGTGLGLTTRSCLLNSNRNPDWSQAEIERCLCENLGVDTLVWLDDGLLNDHTDGHIDNIARFVAPGVVVCQRPAGENDPNRDVLQKIEADLRAWRSPSGKFLQVVEIPSPGKVLDESGSIVPASHMNFYIANHKVIVPVYGTPSEAKAVNELQSLFPGREVVGLPANGVLMGGGSFHCITQQQPA